MTFVKRILLLATLVTLAACSTARVLAPTPNNFANGAYPQSSIPPAYQTAQAPIFYVTDRGSQNNQGSLGYNAERSSSTVFGASTVAFGKNQSWQSLLAASGSVKRSAKLPLNVVKNEEIVRFDSTPVAFRVINGKPVREPHALSLIHI